jgi:hypothetical protein
LIVITALLLANVCLARQAKTIKHVVLLMIAQPVVAKDGVCQVAVEKAVKTLKIVIFALLLANASQVRTVYLVKIPKIVQLAIAGGSV